MNYTTEVLMQGVRVSVDFQADSQEEAERKVKEISKQYRERKYEQDEI